jgi:hypothetical protein
VLGLGFQKPNLTELNVVGQVEAAVSAEPKYGLVARYLALDNRNRADTLKAEMAAVRDSFKRHDYDTGSSQVQGTLPALALPQPARL